MLRVSYPRRQQYRRLRRAAASGSTGLLAGSAAAIAAGAGALAVAGAPALITLALLVRARHWVAPGRPQPRRGTLRGRGPASARNARG